MTIFEEFFRELREEKSDRPCVGCDCCKVSADQGSDYCAKCIKDEQHQNDPGYKLHNESIREQWDDDETPECPACGGPGMSLGSLGNRQHFRCRNCGMDFSHEKGTPDDETE